MPNTIIVTLTPIKICEILSARFYEFVKFVNRANLSTEQICQQSKFVNRANLSTDRRRQHRTHPVSLVWRPRRSVVRLFINCY